MEPSGSIFSPGACDDLSTFLMADNAPYAGLGERFFAASPKRFSRLPGSSPSSNKSYHHTPAIHGRVAASSMKRCRYAAATASGTPHCPFEVGQPISVTYTGTGRDGEYRSSTAFSSSSQAIDCSGVPPIGLTTGPPCETLREAPPAATLKRWLDSFRSAGARGTARALQ